jgi:hypothetical protein
MGLQSLAGAYAPEGKLVAARKLMIEYWWLQPMVLNNVWSTDVV